MSGIRWLILTCILFFGISCTAASTPVATLAPVPTATVPQPTPTATATLEPTAPPPIESENSLIFPAEAVQAWLWREAGYPEAGQSWTPQPEQIAALEAALIPFLQTAEDPWLKPDPPIWERLPAYERQYAGFIIDDKHIIYGNFLCDGENFELWRDWVVVNDGGDCYFQVKYDVENDALFDLWVNGES